MQTSKQLLLLRTYSWFIIFAQDEILMHLTLRSRVYGPFRQNLLTSLRNVINTMISELDATIKGMKLNPRGHVQFIIEGSDQEFVANLIEQEFGTVPKTSNLTTKSSHLGQLVDVGKVGYGIYVDIGVMIPTKMDALIPLHILRDQLEMSKKPLRKIAKSLILVDNLPIQIELTSVDLNKQRLEAKISNSFIDRLQRWMHDDHERLLVFGVSKEMIEGTLNVVGHREDIYRIEQLGTFEYSLKCKRSTRASGILAAIGPKMKGIPMHLFIPREVEENRHATT